MKVSQNSPVLQRVEWRSEIGVVDTRPEPTGEGVRHIDWDGGEWHVFGVKENGEKICLRQFRGERDAREWAWVASSMIEGYRELVVEKLRRNW